VYLHVAPTGYSPLRNAVSEYGVGRYAWGYRAQVTLAALAAICLAGALPSHPVEQVTLLLVFAAARIAIAFFPTDLLDSREMTRAGRVHLLLAAVAFTAICWCMCVYAPRWLGYVATVGAVGTFLALRRVPQLRPILGLLERVFYAATIAWFIVNAIRLS
jgi:uncharacterized protein DUF998